MRKVLFLHLGLDHYAYHIVPIAAELSKMKGYKVTICGTKDNFQLVDKVLDHYPLHKCKKWKVRNYWLRQLIEDVKYKIRRPKYIFKRYKEDFGQFDFVVSPTISFARLRDLIEKPNLLMAYSAHGAGDGHYGFVESINLYDLWLLSGPKITKRLEQMNRQPQKEVAIIGYPKFDLLKKKKSHKVFDNDRLTFLYNPHFRRDISSYYLWGKEVLEFFKYRPEYNLIFAPHIVMFDAELKPKDFPAEFKELPNIHVDLGSESSVDMTYVNTSDVYIGDASSQVYEFLEERKPCVFLNPNAIDWKKTNDFYHWQFGEVVNKREHIVSAIESCFDNHQDYLEIQNRVFDETFELTDELSGIRAAKAIDSFLDKHL